MDEQESNHELLTPMDNHAVGMEVAALVGTMAATPFLQAVATHFGSALAGSIDEATRGAVRRFLRREVARAPAPTEPESSPMYLHTERGWVLVVDAELPAEALQHLLLAEKAAAPALDASPPPRLVWGGVTWRLTGVRDGGIAEHTWEPAAGRWN
ncbi:hypothetical protein [Streptomyces sp. NPDC093225]|uniref:hypothetical protein n=1 Tax=Streptomyces sp. NPDC093225 TaxID=3366034 RepID=UPI0037F922B3